MEQLNLFNLNDEYEPYAELNYRRLGGLAIRLLWEKGTVNTVVEVVDHNKKTYSLISTPEGAKPHKVFDRPFAPSEWYDDEDIPQPN